MTIVVRRSPKEIARDRNRASLDEIRAAGRGAVRGKGPLICPYPGGTLESYVWEAGYQQDVRSMDELRRAFKRNGQ